MSLMAAALLALSFPAAAQDLMNGRLDVPLPLRAKAADIVISGIQSLPASTRYELFTLYQGYIKTVNQRREQRWHVGLLSGEIIEHPEEAIIPARQLEDSISWRQAEAAALEAQVKQERLTAPPPVVPEPNRVDWSEPLPDNRPKKTSTEIALKAKRKELRVLQRQFSRSKGLDIDWSDAVWADLQKVEAEHWSVTDQARTTAPRHTGAIVCTPVESPVVCVAFDPWKTGEPDVYEYNSWDRGTFEGRVPPDYFLHDLTDKP